ncbi:SDR family oxidoreductase [Streptomyces sp. NPDC048282]|uniref:SDR family oxidoreductase n=1 Tax=Streptomyces sp. NPDC048282 TaxID=3365528 RepID=UPI003713C9A1
MSHDVVVVIGVGGMGLSIARRQGVGRKVLLADFSEELLSTGAETLRGEGYDIAVHPVDVSSRDSVTALAGAAAALGSVVEVVHTAGVSPVVAPPAAVLAVDLLGVALMLEEFGKAVAPGGAGIVISSMAGHMVPPLTAEQQEALTHTPADELLNLPFLADPDSLGQGAYALAKRANQLRVQAASVPWGERGARINSISPGVISTPMGQEELVGESGASMRAMIDASAAGRLGTPADITEAAAFLLGPTATFITGTDLLVDGGVIAALRSGRVKPTG